MDVDRSCSSKKASTLHNFKIDEPLLDERVPSVMELVFAVLRAPFFFFFVEPSIS